MKSIVIVISLFFLVACGSAPSIKNDSQLYLSLSGNNQSTMYGWYKVNATTLGFKGVIVPGSYNALLKVYLITIETQPASTGVVALEPFDSRS